MDMEIENYGKNKPYKGKEDDLQISCARLLRIKKLNGLHVPNGGRRGLREAGRFKLMGVTAGVSDLIILQPVGKYHGLVVELKAAKGALRDTQEVFLNRCIKDGYYACVVWNFDAFEQILGDYLDSGSELHK